MTYALATRLHCTQCGAEVLVTQPGTGILRCCGMEMSEGAAREPADAAAKQEERHDN
jgi:hypothetical protein